MAKASGCLRGCAFGCGAAVLLAVLAGGGALVGIHSLADRAVEARKTLEATLPDTASFVPSADGALTADRVERFLAVRQRLMPFCPRFTELADGMSGMDRHVADLEANPDATARDLLGLFGRVGRLTRGMAGVGRGLADYGLTRNEALLEQEMGLGEYTWIYVIVYYGWLAREPTSFALADREEPRIFEERVLAEVREMTRRRLAAATADGEAGFVTVLRDEVAVLDADLTRVPWADGLPPALSESLEPYRGKLASSYCRATSELDFMRTEKADLGHSHN